MSDPFLPRRLVTLIEASKINVTTEAAAHEAIADVLHQSGYDVRKEVRLSGADRVDLMVDGVAIEVKTGHRRRNILKQLRRYATHDQVTAVILATGVAFNGTAFPQLNGKPFYTASLSKGWL